MIWFLVAYIAMAIYTARKILIVWIENDEFVDEAEKMVLAILALCLGVFWPLTLLAVWIGKSIKSASDRDNERAGK